MKLTAFTRTPAGLFKVYDHSSDYQVIGAGFERWATKSRIDPQASLQRAIELIPQVNPADVIYTGE